ncbi:MAG: D-amino acid aminotransferase [Armatimonadetes bacterium]|nr:D-amino acid aminotransferase [Armatimonadota bacterium]
MKEVACLNGRMLPLSEARIPVDDRGFLFGDSVYEVARTYGGRIWALDRHLARLRRSLAAIAIEGADLDALRADILEAHRQSEIETAVIYIQITRGVAPRSHVPDGAMTPTVLVTVRPLGGPGPTSRPDEGVRALLMPEARWARRDIKSTNLLPNILAKREARSAGAFEAIFTTDDGWITEGSSSNVFVVQAGTARTPPKGAHLLPGITRDLVIEITRDEGIPLEEALVSRADLFAADEVFLTGTGAEVIGVVRIDEETIGSGRVGPVTRRLLDAYHEWIAAGRDGLRE